LQKHPQQLRQHPPPHRLRLCQRQVARPQSSPLSPSSRCSWQKIPRAGEISTEAQPILVEQNASTGAIRSQTGSITIEKGGIVQSIALTRGTITLKGGAMVIGNIDIQAGQITLEPGAGVIGKITVSKPSTGTPGPMRIDIGEKAGVQGGVILGYRSILCVAKGGGAGRVSGAKAFACPETITKK
jgi:hypothetical protein